MPTATNTLSDLSTLNAHLVEQYKNLVSSTMLIFFKNMEKKINKEIKGNYDEENLTITEKNKLKRRLNEIQKIELNKIHKQIMQDSYKFLGVEAKTYENQLKAVLEDVSNYIKVHRVDSKTLKHNYDKSPIAMDKGEIYTLSSLWATFFLSVKTNLNQNTESAYTLRKTTREYTKDLNLGYKTNENSLNAFIAVILQQAYGIAMKSVNNVNEEYIKGYIWDSVMDSRTSDFCITHNTRFWFYGHPELSTLEAEIYAPAHYRCRASNPPIIKSYRELGIPASDLTKSQKALLQNSTVTNRTYQQFLDTQPESVKKSILGKVRYNAYQNGTEVGKFFTRDGRRLTLKQLQTKGVTLAEDYLRYVN